jgi:hypothetical protein
VTAAVLMWRQQERLGQLAWRGPDRSVMLMAARGQTGAIAAVFGAPYPLTSAAIVAAGGDTTARASAAAAQGTANSAALAAAAAQADADEAQGTADSAVTAAATAQSTANSAVSAAAAAQAKADAALPAASFTSNNIDLVGGDPTARAQIDLGTGQVKDRIDWVTPETFGALGNGDPANTNVDTAAWQAAIATGRPVMPTTGKNYQINAELMPPVGRDLIILGTRNTGTAGATLTAVSGFTGYMLRPRAGYDIRDVKLSGNNEDGCYLIGSPDDSAAGLARLERMYFSNADFGVNFGDLWEHPWGLYYNQLVGVDFRTGGINLGGLSAAASSGESAWSMDNINMIGRVTGNGIAAPGQAVAQNTPNATSDTITWDNSVTPYYGWCVMRSANGTTGWHIPPNWTSAGLNAGSFVATKTSGETWVYNVVRMTRGMHIRRAKSIHIGIAQLEYFGIGVSFQDVNAAAISQFYAETRDRSIPLSQFAGVFCNNSALTFGGGWCENFGYGVVSWANSQVAMNGPYLAAGCRWGKALRGGSTAQTIEEHSPIRAGGSTPNVIVSPTGGAFEYNGHGAAFDRSAGATTWWVDGANSNALEVRRRGVTKARMFANANGEGEISGDRLTVTLPNKTLRPQFINSANFTDLTPGSATALLTISGMPSNSAASLDFVVAIQGTDTSGSVRRQSLNVRLQVALVETAGTGVTAAVSALTETKAIQGGTMGTPVFTASVSSGVVTISCNLASSMGALRAFVNLISANGPAATAVTVTQA